jgi:hypothetical protein
MARGVASLRWDSKGDVAVKLCEMFENGDLSATDTAKPVYNGLQTLFPSLSQLPFKNFATGFNKIRNEFREGGMNFQL